MTYDLINFGTDADAELVTMTPAEMALGFLCGQVELGKLNFLFQKVFTDLKTVNDLDDFLQGISIVEDPANPGKYIMEVDLNEAGPSTDFSVALTMFSEDVVNVGSGADIFRDKTGNTLNFRGVSGGGDITTTVSGDNIVVSFSETKTTLTGSATNHTITYVDEDGNSNVIDIAALVTTFNINGGSLTNGILTLVDQEGVTPDVTIDLNTFYGGFTYTGGVHTYDRGDGTTYAIDVNASALPVDDSSLSFTSSNVQEALDALDNLIAGLALGEVNTGSNVGTGQGLFKQKVGSDLEFKSLTTSGGAVISQTADEVNILAGRVHAIENLNGGSPGRSVYQGETINGAGNYIACLREMVGGGGINIVQGTSTLNFSVDEAALITSLCANPAFKTCVMNMIISAFSQSGSNLIIADGVDSSGNPTFTPCP